MPKHATCAPNSDVPLDSPDSRSPRGDVEKRALVRCTLADIRIAVGAQQIDRALQRLAVGSLPRYEYDARKHLVADPQHEADCAALIEQPNPGAIDEAAPRRLVGMQDA